MNFKTARYWSIGLLTISLCAHSSLAYAEACSEWFSTRQYVGTATRIVRFGHIKMDEPCSVRIQVENVLGHPLATYELRAGELAEKYRVSLNSLSSDLCAIKHDDGIGHVDVEQGLLKTKSLSFFVRDYQIESIEISTTLSTFGWIEDQSGLLCEDLKELP